MTLKPQHQRSGEREATTMSLSTHHAALARLRSVGPFLVGVLGTSFGLFVLWTFAHPQTLLLTMAALLVSGAIVGLIQQDRTAMVGVMFGSLLTAGVVGGVVLWSMVTGSLSSNFWLWVVAGELVVLAGVSIMVGMGFALGAAVGSIVRGRT